MSGNGIHTVMAVCICRREKKKRRRELEKVSLSLSHLVGRHCLAVAIFRQKMIQQPRGCDFLSLNFMIKAAIRRRGLQVSKSLSYGIFH